MKAGFAALATIAIVAATSGSAEARGHHRHGYYGCHMYDDYAHSNALSGLSYIRPAANWGPFFRCRMYSSPVISVLPTPAYLY